MQTTERRPAPVWRRVLIALAIVIAADLACDFAFGSYATLSGVTWDDYRRSDEIDCLFVGSSYAERAFDPTVMDEVSGSTSFNLATPGQVISDTYDTLRVAMGDKELERVVVGIGVQSFTLTEDPTAHVSYLRARYRDDPASLARGLARLAVDPQVIGTESSLNVLFPWCFTSVQSLTALIDNVEAKLTSAPLGPAAERVVAEWHYVGQGYGNYETIIDPTNPNTTALRYGTPYLQQDCLDQLSLMADLCREQGVEFVAVATPHPAFDIASTGDAYPALMAQVQELVEQKGGLYLDFALAREELLSLELEDYCDFEHLNLDGARKLTAALADTLMRHDAGEDVTKDFYDYDDWDAWLADHDLG